MRAVKREWEEGRDRLRVREERERAECEKKVDRMRGETTSEGRYRGRERQ